jgi:hypothetical protein
MLVVLNAAVKSPSERLRRGQSPGPPDLLASNSVDLDQVERRIRERLDALGPAPRAELLHVLMLPDLERPSESSTSG